MKTLHSSSAKNINRAQSGHALVVGIIAMVLLAVAAIGFLVLVSSQKEKPVLTVNQPNVNADDTLTTGKSNNELAQDVRILMAGNKRDGEQADAANKTLSDAPQPIVDDTSTDTTVETDRLSQLQIVYGKEVDRRVAALKEAQGMLNQLTQAQQNALQPSLAAEIGALGGLKTRATTESSREAFDVDKANLDKEYYNFLLYISQVKLLACADDQAVLVDKYNTLGGKFQERLNTASNNGTDVSMTQITLNNYQAHKTKAKNNVTEVLQTVPGIKAGDYNANRAVLKTYQAKLQAAHDEMAAALTNATTLTLAIQKLPQ